MVAMPESDGPAPDHETFRASSTPWLTGFLVVLGVLVLVGGWGHTTAQHAGAVCGGLALVALAHALYWRCLLYTSDAADDQSTV